MYPDENVARAAVLDTATLSDALDRLGIVGQCDRIAGRDPAFALTGRAFTMLCGPAATPPGTVGDYIDDVPPGHVVVIDNGGREDATIWGDILTEIAHRRGLAGTVIDGISRDVALCRALAYPVFSRGHWMRTGKDRVQVEAYEQPVSLGDVRVCPGDLIVGDADGIVVVARARLQEVLQKALATRVVEEQILASALAGTPLTEARKQFSYHSLQRAADSPLNA